MKCAAHGNPVCVACKVDEVDVWTATCQVLEDLRLYRTRLANGWDTTDAWARLERSLIALDERENR